MIRDFIRDHRDRREIRRERRHAETTAWLRQMWMEDNHIDDLMESLRPFMAEPQAVRILPSLYDWQARGDL